MDNTNSIMVDYPVPPPTVMPAEVQHIFLIVTIFIAGAFLLYALRQGQRYRSALPVLYFVASLCTIPVEPLTNFLGMVVHSEAGQIAAFKTYGRHTPLHIVFLYSAYFTLPIIFFRQFAERKLTSADLWKLYLPFAIFAYIAELAPLHYGLWSYYGNQAFWVWDGGMPVFWALMNPVICLVPFVVQYVAMPYLTGWRQLLVIPLNAAAACGAFTAAGFPWIMAANSSWGPIAVQLGGVFSIAIGLMLLWLGGRIMDAATTIENAPARSKTAQIDGLQPLASH